MKKYKNVSFSHFKQFSDNKNRLTTEIKTLKEKQYEQNEVICYELGNLSQSFESQDYIEIYKSVISLRNNLKKDRDYPQIIPQDNILQLIEILINYSDHESIIRGTLQVFASLIDLSSGLIDNVNIMINNSFLEIILSLQNDIQTMRNQLKIVSIYLKVIQSLILYCNRNPELISCEHIMQKIDFDFFFSLFQFIKNGGSMIKSYNEWLKCIQFFFDLRKTLGIITDSETFSHLMNIFNLLLNEFNYDNYFIFSLFSTLSTIIKSNTIFQIDWDEFVKLQYPTILSEYSIQRKIQDYRVIRAASDCIGACSEQGFTDFDFNIDDLFETLLQFDEGRMYKSLFYSFTLISAENSLLVDSFFNEKTNNFLDGVINYDFELKKEIAIFYAGMIEFAQSKHINFLIETQSILYFLYEIYTESMDIELLSSMMESFVKTGPIFISLYSQAQLTQIFSEIIPDDCDVEGFDDFDDEIDIENYQLILNDFPFFFGQDSS